MLEQPTVAFKVGQTVLVTLRCKWAGSVTIKVPMVHAALDRPTMIVRLEAGVSEVHRIDEFGRGRLRQALSRLA